MYTPSNKNRTPIKAIPLEKCIAKTITDEKGVCRKGITVEKHCILVGKVAHELLKRIPDKIKKDIIPECAEIISALHDIGKISPTFQEKLYLVWGEKLGITNPDLDETIGYHFTVSRDTLREFCPYVDYVPDIVGRHHGVSPSQEKDPESEIYGGKAWQDLRKDCIQNIKKEMGCDIPEINNPLSADILSGLTTVSDWIASGTFFDNNNDHTNDTIISAVNNAGILQPCIKKNLTFESIFGFTPRLLQEKMSIINNDGLYIVEAPMGMGKTEAALWAAYKQLSQGNATGIYFALPTQLTSDKMHERMQLFFDKIIDSDTQQRPLLLHSAAWLKDTEIGEDGSPGKSWFNSAKRGLLAPFAVGTVDQALMAVMNIKHGFVRTFGLLGKVVILDEVHSYDFYTGTILCNLVKALRQLHCTVIILSATLTKKQRTSLMENETSEKAYPLISAITNISNEQNYYPIPNSETSEVEISLCDNDSIAIEKMINRAERGEHILWIENTIDEAQGIYRIIAERCKGSTVECGLLHSRFTKQDRADIESRWVTYFGREGRLNATKNNGKILIGTQVLEQSLDIDADYLITRLCPTDMLFQRIGRLWRHRQVDIKRPSQAKREALILSPKIETEQDSKIFGRSSYVYAPYVLFRTYEVWNMYKKIVLPTDIRPMLEKTYEEREENDFLKKYKNELNQGKEKLERFALIHTSRNGKTLPESDASTRYSEEMSVDVLLINKIERKNEGTVITLLDGKILILNSKASKRERKEAAVTIMQNTVKVPIYKAPETRTRNLEFIKPYIYIGDNYESLVRIAIVKADTSITGLNLSDPNGKYDLYYNTTIGYQTKKRGKTDE